MTDLEAEAKRLYVQGEFGIVRTARALGVSPTTVRRYVTPGYRERSQRQSREAKRRRTGICSECGATTRYAGKGKTISDLCQPCASRISGEERKLWTRDLILSRIHEWNENYGQPPCSPDWSPTHAHNLGDEERARIFLDADRHWPHAVTVIREFGSWNEGIKAAGFPPNPPTGSAPRWGGRRAKSV